MKRTTALFISIVLVITSPVCLAAGETSIDGLFLAQTDLPFDPVEQDLMLKEDVREDLLKEDELLPKKKGGSKWLYLLVGVGVIGLAAGGGGGGGGGSSTTGEGTVIINWQ